MSNEGRELNSEREGVDINRLILQTAIKTAFRLFVLGTLVFVLFLGMFPLRGMYFFESVGLRDRALYMASMYARQEERADNTSSKYAEALYHKMLLAEELYLENSDSKKAKKYLDDIYNASKKYLKIPNIEQRNKQIDTQNLQNFPPFAQANVFSFTDRISNLNYFAAVRLDKESEYQIAGNSFTLSDMMDNLADIDNQTFDTYFTKEDKDFYSVQEYFIFFGQTTEYIKYSLDNDLTEKLLKPDFLLLLDLLSTKIELFEQFSIDYYEGFTGLTPASELEVRQTQLYLTRCIGRLYDYILTATQLIDYDKEEWSQLANVSLGGLAEEMTVTDYYYAHMLPQFTAYYNQL